jgi:branched-chain amino acid aminotransferase
MVVLCCKSCRNYAAQFYPTNLANKQGFQQVIWTDDATHTKLEEAGTMNVFFRINDTLLTAPIRERILDGITRKSLIDMAIKKGFKLMCVPSIGTS